MPVEHDPAAGAAGRMLVDGDGRVLARFILGSHEGRPRANRLVPEAGVDAAAVAAAALRDLAGHVVAGPLELGQALVAIGGRPQRHAHRYAHELTALPAVPEVAVDVQPVRGRAPEEFVPASLAAYGPEHPDFHIAGDDPERTRGHFAAILDGRMAGPLLPCSRIAVADDGEIVAAGLVVEGQPGPGADGPWLIDLFRRPDHPGLGRALLARILHAASEANRGRLSLIVTEGNPAVRLYERMGFRRVVSFYDVVVP